MRIRLDMHTHTEYSADSRTALASFVRAAATVGLGAVCITDHHTIDGALRLREMDLPFRLIVGEEIFSEGGEIIGLFLTERIPPHLSIAETMHRIHAQGGLVYIPHPFSRNRRRHLKLADLVAHAAAIDAIEVFNAREIATNSNVKALAFAIAQDKPGGVGSDAHRAVELGRAYVEIDDFASSAELLAALRGGVVMGSRSSMSVHVRTWADVATKIARRLAGRS